MWEILEHRQVDRQLRKAPREVLVRYEKWKDVVSLAGPPGPRLIKGFHDELLSGDWVEHRSSRLGLKWRVIYRVLEGNIEVHVTAVPPHDHRRI